MNKKIRGYINKTWEEQYLDGNANFFYDTMILLKWRNSSAKQTNDEQKIIDKEDSHTLWLKNHGNSGKYFREPFKPLRSLWSEKTPLEVISGLEVKLK